MTRQVLTAGALFDGQRLLPGHAVEMSGGVVTRVGPVQGFDAGEVQDLGQGLLVPGFVDLQVNGGGGLLFNDAPTRDTLQAMARAHARLGSTSTLPTLITDQPHVTEAAIDAAIAACGQNRAVIGLHLEGPHLSLARKGAHEAAYVRPMSEADLALYLRAAAALPVFKLTLAPESATPEQVAALVAAGAVVSLGHSDARYEACASLIAAGATCVTHMFNAMSQLTGREPGLVGAALQHGEVHAGLIADGIHVSGPSMALALRAKQGPGQVFLVSDSMAVAGSDLTEFTLNGRRILRRGGRLTLEDGTLAGADLDMAGAVRGIMAHAGAQLPQALAMATSRPAEVVGQAGQRGSIEEGAAADLVWLDTACHVQAVWQGGQRLSL